MSEFFAFLVLGIIQGMTYGIVALGMVLIYKGTRVLNFAQPFMGLFAAFLCWYFTGTPKVGGFGGGAGIETGPVFIKWLRYPMLLFPFDVGTRPRFIIAAIWSLALIAFFAWRFEQDVMRHLERAPRLVGLVATIALLLGLVSTIGLVFLRTTEQQSAAKRLPTLIPESVHFDVGALRVTSARVLILIVVPIVAVAAALFFKYTKFGIAIRAAAENREAAQLLGISARRVSSFTWIAGGFLAGIAALLIVPAQGTLDATALSFPLLISALTAALVGGLNSLPGAFAGGIIIGIAEFLTHWRTQTTGVAELVFFGMVIVVLAFRPGGLFGVRERLQEGVALAPSLRELPRKLSGNPVTSRARVMFVLVGVMLVCAASLATGPFTNGVLTDVTIFAIVGVSLTVLIGYAGQISLGHWALVGVGAFAAGNLYDHSPVPFPLVFPLVFLIGMVVALAIGLPALRIRGPYLAVVTLAFALACYLYIFRLNSLAHGTTGVTFTSQHFGYLDFTSNTNRPMFFFAFGTFLFCAWIAYNFKQSRTGRGFFSLRENEKAAATLGVALTRYRLFAFMLSGGIAALAGSVFVLRQGSVAALDFPVEYSVLLVAMVIIGGLGSITGAALGAFLLFGLQRLITEALGSPPIWVPYVVSFAAGLALILVLTRARGGLAGLFFSQRDPIIQGIVWQDEDARALSDDNGRTSGDIDGTVVVAKPRPRARARS
jgi:ABC-type branched-subunit amino acid transport system permease subunit